MKYKIIIAITLLFLLIGVCSATENMTSKSDAPLKQICLEENSTPPQQVNEDLLKNENNDVEVHTENVTISFDKNNLNNKNEIPTIYLTKDHPEYSGEIAGFHINIQNYSKNGYTGHILTIKTNTSKYLNFNSNNFERGQNNTYTYEMLYGIPTRNTISDQYSPYKTHFIVYYYPSKNLMDVPHPDNYYRLIPNSDGSKGTVYYEDIKIATFNFGSRYVSKTYLSLNNTFELEIYPYVATLTADHSFYEIPYNDSMKIIVLKDNEKFDSTISYDGWFKINIYKKVDDYQTIKKPVYTYKKVKNGYKWKYYKTKWHNTKIITHKWKKGKLVVYHNKLRKVKKLLNKNGKIIKTVYSPTKRTVYLKYPVDYYKKVKKYKYVQKLVRYDSINEYTGFHYEFEKSENRKYI